MSAPDTTVEIDGCKVLIRTSSSFGMQWRCGYVTFPDGEAVPSEMESRSAPVNGGITYENGRCVGWDYMHGFNQTDRTSMPPDDVVIAEARTLIAWVRSGAWRDEAQS